MNINKIFFVVLLFIIVNSFLSKNIYSQSFGRNKPHYRNFNFKIKETPNFDIYYYMNNNDLVNREGQNAELWYSLHKAIFQDSFAQKNPLLLYNNHSDFQQTNAIGGSIGVGTGGVTEAFKNRVVIPMAFTNQQNFHVLGHELVHAFQYNTILNGDSTSLRSLQNIPLWMVEGLAEYLSKGRNDAFTSMWMRDAVLNDDIPDIKDLSDPKYFPYRYGQAFWAFITGTYGDEAIRPFFVNTAIFGLRTAIDSTFNTSYTELSDAWISSLKSHYSNYIKYNKEKTIGKKVISDKNAGRMNVSPSISPNGKYTIFISEKDVFTTDWYLAKTSNGKIIRKISSRIRDAHLENYNFMESSGTWSPDSKKFAFVAFNKGRNIMVVKEAKTGETIREFVIDGVPAFTNPAWSPDGKYIVVTGMVEGQVDLFAYYLKSNKLIQLTDDVYSEIQSDFSKDGKKIVFSTDKISMLNGRTNGKWKLNIAILDVETKKKSSLNIFRGADNINPLFDNDNNIYFLSDRDGFRNIYKYNIENGKIFQKTDFIVGVSGITEYSPAISISKKKNRILYTLYNNKNHSIYNTKVSRLLNKEVKDGKVDNRAGVLPKPNKNANDIVNANLRKIDRLSLVNSSSFVDKKYKPKFKLDYLGGGTAVGVGNSTFGTSYGGLAGGIDLLFSDMLGNHQLYSRLSVNGEIYDFGGQFIYMNRQKRVNWGVGLSHVPYSFGYRSGEGDYPLPYNGDTIRVDRLTTNVLRVFDERLSVFWHYPFSKTLRIEGGIDGGFRSFRQDKIFDYYQQYPYGYIGRDKERVTVPDTLALGQYFTLIKGFSSSLNVAIVGDNSFNGVTSPLSGYKYRVSLEKYFGSDDYQSVLADFRYYHWLKPVSFAFRAMTYLRFENETNSKYPIYIGQMGFVRGYSFSFGSNPVLERLQFLDHMLGSKMIMGNFEIRLPFTGIERLSLIKSKYFLSDLAFFFDIGVAFDEFSHLKDGEQISGFLDPIIPKLAKSVGLALRVNLFGAMIVEPYLAYPLEKDSKIVFGLNLMPGF